MARSRNIKPGLFKNEILGESDPIYSLLFVGLWTIADKEGRLEYRPKKIKAEIFPYRFDLDVSLALAWLKHESFITVYGIDEDSYIQINNWRKHQLPHHKETDSTIPSLDEIKKIKQKQKLAQDQAKLEATTSQDQAKQIASCPTDSLNLIPDSLNPSVEACPKHGTLTEKFSMHLEWIPHSDYWEGNCHRAGIQPDYKNHLHEFRLYWQNRDDTKLNEQGWQGKLINNIKSGYQRTKLVNITNTDQPNSTPEGRQALYDKFTN